MLDTVDFPVLFWGAIRAGIVPVLLNTRLTVDQYRYLFEDSRAKAVFVSTALLPAVQEAAKDLPNVKEIVVVGGGPASVPRLDTLVGGRERRLGTGQNLRRRGRVLALFVRHDRNAEGHDACAFDADEHRAHLGAGPHRHP